MLSDISLYQNRSEIHEKTLLEHKVESIKHIFITILGASDSSGKQMELVLPMCSDTDCTLTRAHEPFHVRYLILSVVDKPCFLVFRCMR